MAEMSLREELNLRRQRAGASLPPPASPPVTQPDAGTASQAFTRSAIQRLLGNVMAIPDLAATAMLSIPDKAIADVRNLFRPAPVAETWGQPLPEMSASDFAAYRDGPLPNFGERLLPLPSASTTANHAFGLAQLLGESAAAVGTGNFGQFTSNPVQHQTRVSEQLAAEHPTASAFGTAAGDAATLVAGRMPIVQQLTGRAAIKAVPQFSNLPADSMRTLYRFMHSAPMKSLATTAGRATEAGLEGAALSILNGGDPLESAAYAAGAQTGGSILLGMTSQVFSGSAPAIAVKVGASAYGIGSMLQLAKSGAPGGNNSFMESLETGYSKVLWGLALGSAAGLAGAGRLRGGPLAEELPRFADALTALPRGAVLSKINEYLSANESDQVITDRVLMQLATDPAYFGPSATAALQKALTTEASLTQTIQTLIANNEDFRAKFDSMGQQRPTNVLASLDEAIRADTSDISQLASATRTAELVTNRIPLSSPHRRTSASTGPRTFLNQVMSDPQTAPRVLNALGAKQRQGLLEVQLGHVFMQGMRDVNGKKVVDADLLQNAWGSMPIALKQAYPTTTRTAVERFISEAKGSTEPFTIIPQMAAHSIMQPNGELARRLGLTK